jgi:hypothetical protein
LRNHIVLISMLILWASAAYGAVDGDSVGLDVLGSEVNNSTIVSYGSVPIEVDIIGSTANNIQIGYPEEEIDTANCSYCGICDSCGRPKYYTTPWDDFTRPLCYPWSSYIPTRYNKDFINRFQGFSANSANTSYAMTIGQGRAIY